MPLNTVLDCGSSCRRSLFQDKWGESMERRNQNILIGLIGLVIVVAVFSSFGLALFTAPTPTITLPTAVPSETPGIGDIAQGEGTRVEITPATVQSTIEALSRIGSYSRTVTTSLEGAINTAQVWVDGGWTRSDLSLSSGVIVHTLVGDGTVWRWYGNDPTVITWAEEEGAVDFESQGIPTFEDVLALEPSSITSAGYGERDGYLCINVEVDVPELGQKERYWVSTENGLLVAAETEVDGAVVWAMTTTVPEIPIPSNASFSLPDGTSLHQVGGQ